MTTRRTLTIGLTAALAALTLTIDAADARTRKKAPPVDAAITATQALDPATAAALDAAIAGAHRSDANKARDQFRHPKETLAFFGLKSDMQVLEVNPGAGWFTEVLAPTLREKGQLYVTGGNPNAVGGRQGLSNLLGKFAKDPGVYDKVKFSGAWQAQEQRIQPGSLDMVVTFRNIHNFVYGKVAEQQFKDWYTFLKPGGVLGVEEHRWPEGKPNPLNADGRGNGYMTESEVIALANAAGFQLVGKSEINANPKDTKDYANGVWALPPTLAGGETDKAKYQAIGESDRMVLKFVKPAT
ncbi:MAG: methyltransferase [Alphaproteobacteria bacterium]|nr:methyltransferase [Alphaproteobacteria bacterium]